MTAPTTGVRFLLARAAVRATGALHVVSQRDSGLLMPVCGANPIRSQQIETHTSTHNVRVPLCDDCAGLAATLGGIDSLLDTTSNASTSRLALRDINAGAVHIPADARTADDGLTASIRANGVTSPIIVTTTDSGYQLVAGARRLDAARRSGLATIPAIVRTLDANDALIVGLLENLHREDLNPIQLAIAYQRIINSTGCTKQALADRLGISRPQVSNTIRLLQLPADQQARVATGTLTAQNARVLLSDINRAKLPKQSVSKPAPLVDLALALAAQLDVRVSARTVQDRTRITIDVTADDLPRLLEQLGIRPEVAA